MKKVLNSASYSVIHSSAKLNKEDSCLIPTFLYLPQDECDIQNCNSNTQALLSERNETVSQRMYFFPTLRLFFCYIETLSNVASFEMSYH
jgi:hypothetical protein